MSFARLDDESPMQRIISMIEIHAPRLMRTGGGSLRGETKEYMARSRVTAEQGRRMVELERQGVPQWQIALDVKCSAPTVSKWLKRNGQPSRVVRSSLKAQFSEKIRSLGDRGLTDSEIAAEVGLSYTYVWQIRTAQREAA